MIKIETRQDLNYAGSCTSKEEGQNVSICPDFIKDKFDKGYIFMGIKPDNFLHALQIVLEHELCHVILWYKGVLGHGSMFMELAKTYGHTDYMIRRGHENSQDKNKNNKKTADSCSSS